MKQNSTTAWIAAGCTLAGLALGLWVGKPSAPGETLNPPAVLPVSPPIPETTPAPVAQAPAEAMAIPNSRIPLGIEQVVQLIEDISRDPSPSSRLRTAGLIAEAVLPGDLTRTVTLAEAIPYPELRSHLIERLLARWSRESFDEAWRFARSLPPELDRDSALVAALRHRASDNFQQTSRWFSALTNADERADALTALSTLLPVVEPGPAWDFALSLPPGDARTTAIHHVMQRWAESDLPAGIERLRRLTRPEDRAVAIEGLFPRWIDTNATAVAAFVSALPPGESRTFLLGRTVEEWAARDPAAAFGWAERATNESNQFDLLYRIVSTWAARDAQSALVSVARLPSGARRQSLRGAVVEAWAGQNPKAAMVWAAQQGEAERGQLSWVVASRWAADSPAEAAAFVTTLPSGGAQLDAAAAVVGQWTWRDPVSAARWAADLHEGGLRDEALASVAAGWSAADPVAAERWLETFPAGAARDPAVGAFCDQLSRSSPQTAARWVVTITDEARRWHHLRVVAANWLQANESEARNWIQGLSLPAEETERLLNAGR